MVQNAVTCAARFFECDLTMPFTPSTVYSQTTLGKSAAHRLAPRPLVWALVATVWGLAACTTTQLAVNESLATDAPKPVVNAAQVAPAPAPKKRRAPIQRVRPSDRALGEFAATYSCRFRDITIGRVGVGLRLTDGASVFDLDPVASSSGQVFAGKGLAGAARVSLKGDGVAVEVNGKALDRCALTRQWPMASFRATGNEPAWLLKGETELLRWTVADKLFAAAVDDSQPLALAQPLRLSNEPDAPLLSVFHKLCQDSATGMPYPFTVRVLFEGRTLNGCGGDPGSLLIGREWAVTGMGNASTPASGAGSDWMVADVGDASTPTSRAGSLPLSPWGHHVTVRFDGKGKVAGTAHCNQFSGIYALTGERLSIGSVSATRRACVGRAMQDEHVFLRAIETVVGFDVNAQGELTLVTREAAERGVLAGIRAR